MQPLPEPTAAEVLQVEQMKEKLKSLCVESRHLDSNNLLNFLRDKNHSLDKAVALFKEQIEWRESHDMDHILEWKIPPEYKVFWPWHFSGIDLLGNPILILPMGTWDTSQVANVGYETTLRYLFRSLESICGFARKLSQGRNTMKQLTVIADVKELSWKMVTTIDAIRALLEMFRCMDKYYPQALSVAYVINAPFAFGYAWRLIKPFLSENSRSRVLILKGSSPACWQEEFSKVMCPDQFPIEYGGELPFDKEIQTEN